MLKTLFWLSIIILLIIFFTLPIVGLILGFIQGMKVDSEWEKQNKDANIIRKN
jgi:hypothetical protein